MTDRTVLLVDDGVATGSTYLASLLALKEMQVPKVIAAVPVGPPETLSRIAPVEDELVVLLEPPAFMRWGPIMKTSPKSKMKKYVGAWSERNQPEIIKRAPSNHFSSGMKTESFQGISLRSSGWCYGSDGIGSPQG
ncbi:MAG: hypothetical protein IH977_15925 [Nitrospinae bacterium]|nr:hypothetical protein [Nitrospinota bacterium]